MKATMQKLDDLYAPVRKILNCPGAALFDLAVRLYMANIFFKSGMLKFQNYLNDDWGSTLFLFEEIHPVPFLSPQLAAISGTAGELILPVLLALGLFGRFGALGLLFMTITIEFLVPAEYGIQNTIHYFWMFLLAHIVLRGPGWISVDHLIGKWIKK